jgi:signal peptidase I
LLGAHMEVIKLNVEASSAAPTAPPVAPQRRRPRARRLLAALASALVPGLGELILGYGKRAAIFFFLLALLLALFWPVRLPSHYAGFFTVVFGSIALTIAASANTLRLRSPHHPRLSRGWLFLTIPFAVITGLFLYGIALRASGFRPFNIPSTSMEPTIVVGDSVIVDEWQYRRHAPRRGEIIVFKKDGEYLLKRVMAIEGDEVTGRNDRVLLNGTELRESYIRHSGNPPFDLAMFGPVKIQAGKLFVMGDNRDVSLDSRSYGPIDVSTVVGKPLYIVVSKADRSGSSIH